MQQTSALVHHRPTLSLTLTPVRMERDRVEAARKDEAAAWNGKLSTAQKASEEQICALRCTHAAEAPLHRSPYRTENRHIAKDPKSSFSTVTGGKAPH
jgi:hypothetical protein